MSAGNGVAGSTRSQGLNVTTDASRLYNAEGRGLGGAEGGAGRGGKQEWPLHERLKDARRVLRDELERYPVLQDVEESTGIPKGDFVSWVGLAMTLSTLVGLGARHWCEIVGFAYPARATVHVMVHQDKGPVVRWMTYWVTLAFLNLVELSLGPALMAVVPFYYPFKFGFLVWCQSPGTRGSLLVHSHLLAPFLKRHEASPATFHKSAQPAGPPR